MTMSAGLTVALEAVARYGPVRFVDLEKVLPMCERIAASHLKRLERRGFVQYHQGWYTITDAGREQLGHA